MTDDLNIERKIVGNLSALDLDADLVYVRPDGSEVVLSKISLITHKRKGTIVRSVSNRDIEIKHTKMVTVKHRPKY